MMRSAYCRCSIKSGSAIPLQGHCPTWGNTISSELSLQPVVVHLGDNAIVLDDCDFSDVGSTLTGDDLASTVGIVGDDTNTILTLNGTDVSGYATGVSKENGDLFMIGGAYLAGNDYGVFAEDTYVVAIDAHVDGGSTGTGLHVESSPDVWVYPMDASGAIGMYVEDTPFRWDGGVADATTALSVVDATGSVENMSWADATTQVNAGNNAHITSIGNTFLGNPLVGSGELDGTVFQSSSWDGENAVVGIYRAMTGDTSLGRDDEGSVLYMPNPKVTIENWEDPSVAPEW